jgi:hypothetical protein
MGEQDYDRSNGPETRKTGVIPFAGSGDYGRVLDYGTK